MMNILLLTLLGAAVEFEASGPAGPAARGELLQFSSEKVVLKTAEGLREIPTSQLVRIAQPGVLPVSAEPISVWAQLLDGSRLLGKSFVTVDGRARIGLVPDSVGEVPTALLQSVRLKPMSPEMTAQWDEIAGRPPKADCVVIREGDSLDFLEGVLGDFGAESFAFTLNGEALTVKRPKAEGLVFFHANQPTSDSLLCTLADASGSKLNIASLTPNGDRVDLRTTGGFAVSLPLSRIALIEFPAQYLSSWKPETFQYTPRIAAPAALSATVAQFYRPRFDGSAGGGSLKLGGKEYARGLALRSRTEMTFRLPDAFSKFTAVAGIDDRRRPGGNVRLVISADDRVLFDQAVKGGDEPLPISLDITGAGRLKILVDYGDDSSDGGDQLDLCDPRLFP